MIQLSAEVRFANPLLAIAAVHRYDSTLYSLTRLTEYWPNAESILHFFEYSEKLQRQDVHLERGNPNQLLSSPDATRQNAEETAAVSQIMIAAQASPGTTFGAPSRSTAMGTSSDQRPQDGDRNETDVSNGEKQLFPFTGIFEAEGLHGSAYLENWKEMYWQKTFDLDPEFGL